MRSITSAALARPRARRRCRSPRSPRPGPARRSGSSCRTRRAARRTSSPARSRSRSPEALKQTVIVENKPGANGNTGTDFVAKSPADGYTLLLCDVGALAITPSVYTKLPFDPSKDLRGVDDARVLAAPAGRASVGAGEQPEGAGRAVADAASSTSRSPRSAARRTSPASRSRRRPARSGSTSRTRAARRRSATPSPARRRC